MVMLVGLVLPPRSPPHPVKDHPTAGEAVTGTTVPEA